MATDVAPSHNIGHEFDEKLCLLASPKDVEAHTRYINRHMQALFTSAYRRCPNCFFLSIDKILMVSIQKGAMSASEINDIQTHKYLREDREYTDSSFTLGLH